jgi:hypothetical protein
MPVHIIRGNDSAAQLVLDRVRYTTDYYADYFRTLLKFHRYYLSASEHPRGPEPSDVDTGDADPRPDLFVPYSFGTIEAAIPRLHNSWWGRRPAIELVGKGDSDQGSEKAATRVLDHDLEQSGAEYKSLLCGKSFLKYGLALGRVTHKTVIRKKKYKAYHTKPIWDPYGNLAGGETEVVVTKKNQVVYDGGWFDPVSVFNFFPDPLYYMMEDFRFGAELEVTDFDKLERENIGYKERFGKELYKNLDRLKGMGNKQHAIDGFGAWLGDPKEETASIFGYGHGYGRGNRFGVGGGPHAADLRGDVVWLIRYWEKDRQIVLANGAEVIRDKDNPYEDEEIPYVDGGCFPLEFEFYPQGMLHPVVSIQEELNTWRNIAIHQGKLNMLKPLAYDVHSGLSDEDFDVEPGQAVAVEFKDGRPLVVPLYPRDTLPPETYQLEGMMLRDWQNALGMNDYMTGGGPGQANTASEASMMNQSAAARLGLQSKIGQIRFIERMGKKMFSRRQQFLDDEQIFKVLEKGVWEYPRIGPDQIAGGYDFYARGILRGPNSEVERQQIMQLISIAQENQEVNGRIDWPTLLEELVSKFDLRSPDKLIKDPKDLMTSEQLQKLISWAISIGDDGMVESLTKEYERQQAAGQQGGGPGQQQIAGQPGQGSGQLAVNPGDTIPSAPSMMAQIQGGPGGPI